MPYCTRKEVNSLFGDISDEVNDDLFDTTIDNGTAWINSNLKKAYVPVPLDNAVPEALKTANIYYSASDILLSLYHGEELPIQYDVWFNKAQQLLDDYIDAYLHEDAEEADLVEHQMVKHSHSRTYNKKRGRRGIWER